MLKTNKISKKSIKLGIEDYVNTKDKKEYLLEEILIVVQDWLREVHQIHCSVAPWKDDSGVMSESEMYEGNVINVKNDWEINIIDSFHHDYYSCLKSCVEFGLKILKKRGNGKKKKRQI